VKRMVAVATAAVAASVASLPAGCALPHRKDLDDVTKVAATRSTAESVLIAYDNARTQADAHWSASALASAEAGPLLRIDAGQYLVSFRLNPDKPLETTPLTRAAVVASPRFGHYPLWFVTEVPLRGTGVSKVSLFTRQSTITPWRMAYGPEVAGHARLPEFRTVVSAARACADYARALQTGSRPLSRRFAHDTFQYEMRAIQTSQAKLAYTNFRQTWSVLPVRYALRLADGGVLAFATLVRTDRYRVEPGGYLRWHGNAEARAYLPHGVRHWARLRYYHQILMEIPPTGDGEPAVIGQYGGVVSGAGL
jgi:hypothetical protein